VKKKKIITEYARMWPREVFDIMEGNTLVISTLPELDQPGIYILYRDEVPFYVGQSKKKLYLRLHDHSNKTTDRYFHFWNYFSFFVVPNPDHVDEIEGLLIASMPTANSANPKIKQVKLPPKIADILRKVRRKKVEVERISN
jgi:hypothetical protein